MGAADDLRQMTTFPLILTEGGDCRLPLDPKTGANKYHVKPFVHEKTTAFRGSCTCNSPTQVAFDAAQKTYNQLMAGETTCELLMHQTREKLMEMYSLPEGTGIFLMPSGSDAEYIPLLIAQILNQGKEVCNIITCNEEVGSGTLDAAGGKFFSPIEPIPGYTAGDAQMGDPVEGLAEGVNTIAINARQESGEVISPSEQINQVLGDCLTSGTVPVVHTVYGSKTGITHELDEETHDKVKSLNGVLVVDACQGRFRDSMLTELLDSNAIVLITGSKFYRGPPFSGGVIVPAEIM